MTLKFQFAIVSCAQSANLWLLNSLVLEHDVLISFEIFQINAIHFTLTSWMIRETIPADVGEEEAATEIKWILGGFSILVVDAMDLGPFVHRAL